MLQDFSLQNVHLLAASLTQTSGCFSKSWTSLCLTDKLQLKINLEGKELSLAIEVIARHIPTALQMPHPLCLLALLGHLRSPRNTPSVRLMMKKRCFDFFFFPASDLDCSTQESPLLHAGPFLVAHRLSSCGPWAQLLCSTWNPTSPARDWTHVCSIARWILNLWILPTREGLRRVFKRSSNTKF